jgi:MFS family permease
LDPSRRTFAIGIWITSFSVGAAIGSLVGGALLERFWWGSAFLVGVPVMVLLLGSGFEATAAISAIIAVVLSVLAGIVLRQVRTGAALDGSSR